MQAGLSQAEQARRLHALHHAQALFIIGSVWDAASAVMFEQEGFQALGTSSAGIAYAHGLADGEVAPRKDMMAAIARIAHSVSIPVSADLESGYGASPDDVAETCRLAMEAGAVGVNLEDALPGATTLTDLKRQCDIIRAVRLAADRCGIALFINARTDAFWLSLWDAPRRLSESIARCQAYVDAGADGVFVPGALDPSTLSSLVRATTAPLNVLAMPGCPDIATLQALGVRRLSQGSGPARAMLGLARRIARELLDQGRYTSFHQGSIGYAQANALFADRSPSVSTTPPMKASPE
jgi:2-methylisocitrate lyase-like PEP mutase family enzyme